MRRLILAAVLAALPTSVGAQCTDGSQPPCRRRAPAMSVAVLPFRMLGPDTTQQYFADGIADAITNALARLPGVRVTARSSANAFRNSNLDARVIADSLGVTKLVEGSVLKVGVRVRVQARLFEAASGRTLWADPIDRALADIFELQDTVSRAIAGTLGADRSAVAALASRKTASAEAQDHYLRGRALLQRRDEPALLGAVDEFRRAIRADPRYAPAWAGLSSAYALHMTIHQLFRLPRRAGPDSSYDWAARSLAAANRAIELDSTLAEGFAARGYLKLYIATPASTIEQDLVRALRIRPGHAESHGWYAQHLALTRRPREALEEAARAVELDPASVGMRLAYVNTAFQAREYTQAFELARAARVVYPRIDFGAAMEAIALVMLKRPQDCLALPRHLPAIEALCLHAAGRAAEATVQITADTTGWNDGRGAESWRLFNIVLYLCQTSQADAAVRWAAMMYDRTPAGIDAWRESGMLDPVLKQPDGAFSVALERLRDAAWTRVVRESRQVRLP